MVYRLKTVQKLPITVEKAWDFLSDPGNLKNITPDYMGFKILDGPDQQTRYKLISTERSYIEEKWEQPWGEFRYIEDNYEEIIVHLEEIGKRKSLN